MRGPVVLNRGAMAIPFLACMVATAHFYALPPRVLPTIQSVEGGRPGLVHPNSDGSADLGLMQINTRWIGAIAQVVHENNAVVTARLIREPCFSIAAAGAILTTYLREARGDLMLAIGYYHSHTPLLNQTYQMQVRNRAALMFASR
jgi:hypothetical protein